MLLDKHLPVLTLNRPEHRKVITVGDSIRGSGAGSPQTGPIPSDVDNRAATLAANSGHLPALHGQSARNKYPAHYGQEKSPDLHYTDLHVLFITLQPDINFRTLFLLDCLNFFSSLFSPSSLFCLNLLHMPCLVFTLSLFLRIFFNCISHSHNSSKSFLGFSVS